MPKPTPKTKNADFDGAFQGLKKILKKFAPKLRVKIDKADYYWLDTKKDCFRGGPMFFGAAWIKKNYVSFYLMPLYVCPELSNKISPELARRRQGKSCFNFVASDPKLFKELAALTASGFRAYQKKELV